MKRLKRYAAVIAIITTLLIMFLNLEVFATTMTGITPITSFESKDVIKEGEVLTQEQAQQMDILSTNEQAEEELNADGSEGIIVKDGTITDLSDLNAYINSMGSQQEDGTNTSSGLYGGAEEAEAYLDEGKINDDFYTIESGTVVIDKYINGNAYIIADEVVFGNTVSGNVFVIADKIIHKSQIIGSIYEMAENISFENEAYVTGSVYALTNTFRADENTTFNSDLKVVAGDSFEVNCTVFRRVLAYAENATLHEKTFIKNGGSINYYGQLNDMSGNYPSIIHKVDSAEKKVTDVTDFMGSIVFRVSRYVAAMVLMIFISMVSYKYRLRYDNENRTRINRAGAKGVIHIVLVPIISIVFLVSIIGTSVGVILLSFWFMITFLLAIPGLCIYWARRILKTDDSCFTNFVKEVLLASVLFIAIDLVCLIPIAGMIFKLVCVVWGYGIVICSLEARCHKKCGCHKEKLERCNTSEEQKEESNMESNNEK